MKIWVTKDAVYGGRMQVFSEQPTLKCAHYVGEGCIRLGRKDAPWIAERLAREVASRKRGPWCVECDVTIHAANGKDETSDE